MILHHYDISPYSEKIRLMFGYTGMDWRSAISPPMPPREIVDPLIGGYRRIPIGQIGADFFCDTRTIANEIAILADSASLSFENAPDEVRAFAEYANGEVFMPVVQTANSKTILFMLLGKYWPWQIISLMKDRAKVGKTSNMPRQTRAEMVKTTEDFKSKLEERLSDSQFLFGDEPTIADFAAYHLVWFANKTRPKSFLEGPADNKDRYTKAVQWQQRMAKFGHGNSSSISKSRVFEIARDSEPSAVGQSLLKHESIGKTVTIAPTDYARDAVRGQLVGADEEQWIVARQTEEFGTLHLHFPCNGYELMVLD